MMEHPSRPPTAEFIGVKREHGTLVNVDGTAPFYGPSLLSNSELHLSTSCLHVRGNNLPAPFGVRSCSDTRVGLICEAPLRCQTRRSPCPEGWLALDDYCYLYVPTKKNWPDANGHCARLHSGARLAPIINMGTWRILYANLGLKGDTFVGISDQVTEGSFQSIDGSAWSINWHAGQPSNGSFMYDCVRLDRHGARSGYCYSPAHAFICRAPIHFC